MWRKDEVKPQGGAPATPPSTGFPQTSTNSPAAVAAGPVSAPAPLPISARATACISQGIKIKGEVTGKEDLFVDGTVEGKLDLANGSVTVGPNGKVKADIVAREVIVRGDVDGKIDGSERVQLWNTGRVSGEVKTERLAIEDGAVLRGKVEAGKVSSRSAENKKRAASSASEISKSSGVAAGSHTAVI
jgi:cytoskeletal protein CcmA (bactofilin family)